MDAKVKPITAALDAQSAQRRARSEADAVPDLLRKKNGAVQPCELNARLLIAAADQFCGVHFDEFMSRIRDGARDWTDADDLRTLLWLQGTYAAPGFSPSHARSGVRAVAHERTRDSLRQFIDRLPAWDEKRRIESAFTDGWGAPDSALMRAASSNFFVALIARALAPGAQVDTVWAFEGEQGTFKSRSFRALGGEFHAEITAPVGTADFMRELRGLWIAELAELDSLRGREASTVKRLLSAPADRFVDKYAAHAQTYQRRAVFVATTNEASYWQDPTGARRLVPITCGNINVTMIEATRLQWFAEARARHDAGATWWQFPTTITDAQEARQSIDPWEDAIRGFMAHGRRAGGDGMGCEPWPEGWISSATILREWLRLEPHQQGRVSGVRLGHVMRRLDYRPRQYGTQRERGWEPNTADEREDSDPNTADDGRC